MTLRELLEETEVLGVVGSMDIVVAGLGYDSRTIRPGEVFFALAGRRGGRAYRLGDPIDVRVEKIERTEGKVELSPGSSTPAGRRSPGRAARGRPGTRRS